MMSIYFYVNKKNEFWYQHYEWLFMSGEVGIRMIRFLVFSLVHQCILPLPLGPFPSWDEFLSHVVGSFFELVVLDLNPMMPFKFL